MDVELKDFLETFTKNVESKIDGISSRIDKNAASSLESHEATRKQVDLLSRQVVHLWKRVEGSDPPPPTDGTTIPPGGKPLDDQLSDHDMALASMHGKLITVEARSETAAKELAEVKALSTTLADQVAEVKKLNEAQTQAMGIRPTDDTRSFASRIGDLFIWVVKEKEGQKFAFTFIGALTSLVTAVSVAYAVIAGRMPLPLPSTPTIQVQPTTYMTPAEPSRSMPPGPSARP